MQNFTFINPVSVFALVSCAFGSSAKKIFAHSSVLQCFPCFFFLVLGLTILHLTHFELMFTASERLESHFTLMLVGIQFLHHPLLGSLPFLQFLPYI